MVRHPPGGRGEFRGQNCHVTGFKRGIRIEGGSDNRIIDNESFNNWGYSIEIAGGSTGNLIQGNPSATTAAASPAQR